MIFNTPESHRITALLFSVICCTALADDSAVPVGTEPNARTELMGQRFLTLNPVVRVRQIEVTRDTAHGPDESSVHTPAEARNWSLMNRINQKGMRRQDTPIPLNELNAEEQAFIRGHYPELFTSEESP